MRRRCFTEQDDKALKAIMDSEEAKTWDDVATIMNQRYKIKVTQRHCRQRWKFYLGPNLKMNQNQWTDQEVEYIMTLVERYGPDVSVISEAMEGRTPISIRNCLTNQLRRSIRFLQQWYQKYTKITVQKLDAKDLIKLGAVLVNQSPNHIDRTQPLRLRLIDMWRYMQKEQKPKQQQLMLCFKQYQVCVKEYIPVRATPKANSRIQRRRISQPSKKQQKQIKSTEQKMKKQQQKRQRQLMKTEQKEKRKLELQKKKRIIRQRDLRRIQQNLSGLSLNNRVGTLIEQQFNAKNHLADQQIFAQEQ